MAQRRRHVKLRNGGEVEMAEPTIADMADLQDAALAWWKHEQLETARDALETLGGVLEPDERSRIIDSAMKIRGMTANDIPRRTLNPTEDELREMKAEAKANGKEFMEPKPIEMSFWEWWGMASLPGKWHLIRLSIKRANPGWTPEQIEEACHPSDLGSTSDALADMASGGGSANPPGIATNGRRKKDRKKRHRRKSP